MADNRPVPYGAFNFLVNLGIVDENSIIGGFSDVSGLNTEFTIAEYRNGNEMTNYVHKIPGIHKVGDVTLKRGLINSRDIKEWIELTRKNDPKAKRRVVITLLDEARTPVQKWVLDGVIPLKYSGPTLAAKGGGDVAMEELVLSSENIEIEPIN